MSRSVKKQVAKEAYQARVNPGCKVAYEQPLRPRSAVFHTKKEYSRQRAKLETKKAVANW